MRFPLTPPKHKVRWYKWVPAEEVLSHEEDEVLRGRWGKLKLQIYCLAKQGPEYQFDIWEPDGNQFSWEPHPYKSKEAAVREFEKELPDWFVRLAYHRERFRNCFGRLRQAANRVDRLLDRDKYAEAEDHYNYFIPSEIKRLEEVVKEEWWKG